MSPRARFCSVHRQTRPSKSANPATIHHFPRMLPPEHFSFSSLLGVLAVASARQYPLDYRKRFHVGRLVHLKER
jgi:hypothetical protein